MPRQLRKLSEISRQVGMVVMVMSQFCTLTVCSAISTTLPSAPTCGISIQSPTLSMSLVLNCTLATSDRMVSLNTSSSTADIAPRPDSRISGERSISVETIKIPPSVNTAILASCTKPLIERVRACSVRA